jgi:hypothetical protein
MSWGGLGGVLENCWKSPGEFIWMFFSQGKVLQKSWRIAGEVLECYVEVLRGWWV